MERDSIFDVTGYLNDFRKRNTREKDKPTVNDLKKVLGFVPPATALNQRIISKEQRSGYSLQKFALTSNFIAPILVYLLVPDGPGPFKPIITLPGHLPTGVECLIGERFSPDSSINEEAQKKRWLQEEANCAQVLVQNGYLVCAIEQMGFGERVTNDRYSGAQLEGVPLERSCNHLNRTLIMLGTTLIAQRCRDVMSVITWLKERSDLVPDTLGITGNSGGGTTSVYVSALDPRITCLVPSCCFSSFPGSIIKDENGEGHGQCDCNYVPRILCDFGDMGHIGALIAPRPLCIIAGEEDHHFPIKGARREFKTVQDAFDAMNAGDKCSLAVHEHGHQFSHSLCLEWLEKHL